MVWFGTDAAALSTGLQIGGSQGLLIRAIGNPSYLRISSIPPLIVGIDAAAGAPTGAIVMDVSFCSADVLPRRLTKSVTSNSILRPACLAWPASAPISKKTRSPT